MFTPYDKALVGALAPVVVWLCARYGLTLKPDEAAMLVTLITGLLVYFTPNKVISEVLDSPPEQKEGESSGREENGPAPGNPGP